LATVRAVGDRYHEGLVLWQMGVAAQQQGAGVMAQTRWQQAMTILEAMGCSETDEEIRDQLHPLRDRLSAALRGTSARAVRFLITTAASYAPDIGMAAGTGLSALDSFVVDNVISRPGPASFLSRLYPSIFE
jgi:hypothetical protein